MMVLISNNRRLSHDFKTKIYIFVLWVTIRVVLDLSYLNVISPAFTYAGFVTEINWAALILSYFITLTWVLLLPTNLQKPSELGFLLLSLFIVMPVLSFWGLSNQDISMVALVLMSMLIIKIVSSMGNLKFIFLREGRWVFYILAIVIGVMLFFPILQRGGWAIASLNFDDVYERREVVHEEFLGPLGAYLLSWYPKIINPALIAMSYINKKWLYTILFIVVQIVAFMLTTHKEFIIYPFVVLIIAYAVLKKKNLSIGIMKWMLIGLVFSLLLALFTELSRLAYTLIGRTFYSVALNHFDYYEFFQSNPFVIWSNSFLKTLIEFPYSKPIPEIIGADRYGIGSEAFANTGFIASGYMHLGFAGVVLYSAVLGLILKIYDSLVENRVENALGLSISAMAILQVVNVDLSTAFLTQGVGMAMIVLFLLGKKQYFYYRNYQHEVFR